MVCEEITTKQKKELSISYNCRLFCVAFCVALELKITTWRWRWFRFHSMVFFAIYRSFYLCVFTSLVPTRVRCRVCCLYYSLLISCFYVAIPNTTDISQRYYFVFGVLFFSLSSVCNYVILLQIYIFFFWLNYFRLFSLSTDFGWNEKEKNVESSKKWSQHTPTTWKRLATNLLTGTLSKWIFWYLKWSMRDVCFHHHQRV